MDTCLNVLGEPVIFLPATALLAAVLLVWVQLYESTKEKGPFFDFTAAWLYLAILFALSAFAGYIVWHNVWFVSLLIWSFLMTAACVGLAFAMTLARICMGIHPNKPFPFPVPRGKKEKSRLKKLVAFLFGKALVGLCLISFAIAGILGSPFSWSNVFLWVGIVLVLTVIACALVLLCRRRW